jgi:hypothetical protein
VMLIAYSPSTKRSFYTIGGAERYTGQATLEVYPELAPESFQTYISFITEDRKSISRSNYTGQVVLL